MRAIGYRKAGSIDRADALIDSERPEPAPGARDLLVEVKAIAVNRSTPRSAAPPEDDDGYKVLGWDASGIVRAVGSDVTGYAPRDHVYYAGAIDAAAPTLNCTASTNASSVASRSSLDWAEAARCRCPPGPRRRARRAGGRRRGRGRLDGDPAAARAPISPFATASRIETAEWVQGMGAHHVIDHRQLMTAQVAALGLGAPSFVFSTTHSDTHIPDFAELITPQGRFALIDEHQPLDVVPFQRKAVSIHWELVLTRLLFQTLDMDRQKALLDAVADLVDAGRICRTLNERLSPIDAATLKRAHAALESETAIGKIALEHWPKETT